MKWLLLKRGVRNDLAHFPAVVTEVSCPSLARKIRMLNIAGEGGLTHIGSEKHPLRKSIVREICVEHGEIL
jgi:hypothetical protein